MQKVQTPNKRKSFDKTNKSFDKTNKSFDKTNTPRNIQNVNGNKNQTPSSNRKGPKPVTPRIGVTPILQPEKNEKTPKSARKLKNVSPKTTENEEVESPAQNISGSKRPSLLNEKVTVPTPKKQKLQMFSGTSDLSPADAVENDDEGQQNKVGSKRPFSKNDKANVPSPKKQKLQAVSGATGLNSADENGSESPQLKKQAPDGVSLRQRKKIKSKERRQANRKQTREAILKAKQGDREAAATFGDLQQKINKLSSLPKLSSTQKKRLRTYKQLLKLVESSGDGKVQVTQTNLKQTPTKVESKKLPEAQNKKISQAQNKKSQIQIKQKQDEVEEEEESDDSNESDYDVEDTFASSEPLKSGEEQEDSEDESDDDDDDDDDESEDNDVDGDEDSNDQGDQNDNQEKELANQKNKASSKGEEIGELTKKGQSRYVVFVGNMPYDSNKEEIIEHFKKAGKVVDVRIPTDKETKKPRGFAYVEVVNEEAYQRALSLHHTFLKGRRINVLYTQGGKKMGDEKMKDVKAKNFKLSAMRKQGMLAGSVKESQKRSTRRANNRPVVTGRVAESNFS